MTKKPMSRMKNTPMESSSSEGPQGGGPDLPQKVERPLVQMLSGP